MLPRSAPGAGPGPLSDGGTASLYGGSTSLSGYGGGDGSERHADGGPVPSLQRSASGRLPPAYRSWEAGAPEEGGAASEVGTSHGGSSAGGPSTSESGSAPLAPLRYPRDVKMPLGPS